MNDKNLEPIMMKTGQGTILVCPYCKNPIPKPFSYQDGNNRVWKKTACDVCGRVFALDGPYRSHAEANPTVFK